MEVFGLEPLNKKTSAPGHHLTDGRVMLSILPWSIARKTGTVKPALLGGHAIADLIDALA